MTEEQLLKDLDTRATRFWKNVDIRGEYECWPWVGVKQKGKAVYRWEGKRELAYRIAFEIVNGVKMGNVPRYCSREDCMNVLHMESVEYVKEVNRLKDNSCGLNGCNRVAGGSGFCYPHERHLEKKVE